MTVYFVSSVLIRTVDNTTTSYLHKIEEVKEYDNALSIVSVARSLVL